MRVPAGSGQVDVLSVDGLELSYPDWVTVQEQCDEITEQGRERLPETGVPFVRDSCGRFVARGDGWAVGAVKPRERVTGFPPSCQGNTYPPRVARDLPRRRDTVCGGKPTTPEPVRMGKWGPVGISAQGCTRQHGHRCNVGPGGGQPAKNQRRGVCGGGVARDCTTPAGEGLAVRELVTYHFSVSQPLSEV